MIIEKTVTEGSKYSIDLKDYVAEGELTVTITLSEYRDLLRESVENKTKKEKLDWMEQYQRANKAEAKVKELESEISNLYKRLESLAEMVEVGQNERNE